MKKLDQFILKSFLGPFFGILMVVIFILMLQFLWLYIDEAQNLTPHEIKTIITRAGEGTKMVFTGDIFQIDQPYLDQWSNGLTHLGEKMAGQKLFEHVFLKKGERSELSDIAAKLL